MCVSYFLRSHDSGELLAHFEKLLKEKDQHIAVLEAKLQAEGNKPIIDPKIKEKADAEIHELSVIRLMDA